MRKPLISILVPVYNVENYLHRCIDSILAQTLKDIEIILVNDGSTDSSGSICDEYSSNYPEIIKVIHKENEKLSYARKTGVENATGEYIGFIDSDDWIAPEMYEEMYLSAQDTGAQIVFCDWYLVFPTQLKTEKAFKIPFPTVDDFYSQHSAPFMVNKMYHKSLIPYMQFLPNLNQAEDTALVVPLMSNVEKIAYVEKAFYYYFQRESSAVYTFVKFSTIDEYKRALRSAMDNCLPKYREYSVKYCMDLILWGLAASARRFYKADLIEFIQQNETLIVENPFILENKKLSGLINYLNVQTIPKRLISASFSYDNSESASQEKCRNSWQVMGVGYEFIKLTPENCDIENSPQCVKRAYEDKNFIFVENYFKLKYLYEHGGIVISDDILLNMPMGELRTQKTFFGYLTNTKINGKIFGSLPHADILKLILESYIDDTLLNEAYYTLAERIKSLLTQKYNLSLIGGYTQTLAKGEAIVYRCDYLSCDFKNGNCVAQIYNDLDLLCESDENRILINKEILSKWDEDKNKFFRSTKNEENKLRQVY